MVFSKRLTLWYLHNKRDLPWRKTHEPYQIWLSEIMLQQTRIEQGLPYYYKFIEAYPSVFDLANAPADEVLKLWQGLGYYSRARNLHETAKYVAFELDGKFPDTYKGLLKLKGVGDYTASAIASICYNEPVAVVDGNVYRVLSRIFGIDTPINSTPGIKEFKALAQELLDKDDPATFNQAIMEFGALHCKPQNPYCETCPFNEKCLALKDQRIKELPIKLKKTKIKKRYFNYLVFDLDNENTILEQRTGKGIWNGLYQFPLIETEKLSAENELVQLDSFKELIQEQKYSLELYNEEPVVHKLSHQHLYTLFWLVNTQGLQERSVSLEEVMNYPVPVLIGNFLNEYLPDDYK
ncbi:A/G-specific DNA-adenine glycosylase [Christiangramia gaetbulicola]|uniref:Adenine DNA glycosylase n=1 Tax=Christiangramia gaetbulicola TaxID=703340 RepID=A0A2T6ALN1_9FLAO|nr:A/G-specific adenine glycosylase [Christiangramia gaetbulicola]PTX44721.1 A/G-specific DNA-adenine glycosylase [Christiangramia gaetbulicola]